MEHLQERAAGTPHPRTGLSPGTKKRREHLWNHWERWCTQQGMDPMAPQTHDALTYLEVRSQSLVLRSVIANVCDLKAVYRERTPQHNPFDSQEVKRFLRAWIEVYVPTERREVPPPHDHCYPALEALRKYAERTREKIKRTWARWYAWCANREINPLEPSPEQLATYLEELSETLNMNTVDSHLYGISTTFKLAAPDGKNPAQDNLVKSTLEALKREKGQPPVQMTALREEDYIRITYASAAPRPWENDRQARLRYVTDMALISLQRDGLLRASEATALTWKDLTEMDDGSGRLYIARSKTDQKGEGAFAFVSPQPMGWLRELRALADERESIFGFKRPALARHVAAAAGDADLQGRYGGHSSRIGMAQDLALANFTLPQIMNAGRWKDTRMPAYYIRMISAGQNAVAQFYERHPNRANIPHHSS